MKKIIPFLAILLICTPAKSDNYLYGAGPHKIEYEWYPNGTTYTVEANNGEVEIHLTATYINLRGKNASGVNKDEKPCIDIEKGNKVRLVLRGTSELWGGGMCPAIRVHFTSQLTIVDGGDGKLIAHGGENLAIERYYHGGGWDTKWFQLAGGAGIGGGWDYSQGDLVWPSDYDIYYTWNFEKPAGWSLSKLPYTPEESVGTDWTGMRNLWSKGYGACGDIIINSGKIEAYGSGNAPGIGPSGHYTKGGRIEINGGTVYAKGGWGAPGIGCAEESYVYAITINGGDVTAVGGEAVDGALTTVSAPGIGGTGPHCYIEHINLVGGKIKAKAGDSQGHNVRDAVGIGAGKKSKINHINIWSGATVTAESRRTGIPAIGALDGSAIEHIQIFGGNVTAKNGIGKTGEVKDLVISHIEFHNGVVDASIGGLGKGNRTDAWLVYDPALVNAGDLFNYKLPTLGRTEETNMIYGGGNVVFNKVTPDTTMMLWDEWPIIQYYTLQFEDTITTTEGFRFSIGGKGYLWLGRDDVRLTADKKKQLFFIEMPEPDGKVLAFDLKNGLLYKQKGRIDGNPALITLRPDPFGFALIGEITEVNQKILYIEETGEITFFVHGESESDIPDYWYIWYKGDSVVDEGINKNAYTVNWQSDEDVSGYSVELKPFEIENYPDEEPLLPEIIPNAKLTGIEKAIASRITVRRQSNYVIVDTPEKETVSIYDASGMLIQKMEKEAGQIHMDLGKYRHKNFLIVKGQGWVRKVN
ncbi:MAG: hypothetical protein LBF08_03015 [Dysgonamonadaceae bacterium]|jgi:hypothetical protein|nr:hypothetical protein [Dysgonamonadaceae bacterium]